MAYSAAEYERKLNSVFGRHPQVKVEPMMHNERLGYESHEKESLKALEHQQQQKHFAKTIAHKGPNHVKELHEVARNHNEPGYREFADDLAREFKF